MRSRYGLESRIKEHPILTFKRGKEVKITFNGREVIAYEGEPIAAALYAEGVRILTHSLKYHRPKGFFCAIGKCSSCLMRVNGVPNVKTCVTQVKDGMVVETQRARKSVLENILILADRFKPLLYAGSQYHMLTGSKLGWRLIQKVIKSTVGFGEFPNPNTPSGNFQQSESRETDLAVIGGGPAGLSAAIYGARLGLNVVLIDENPTLGGQLVKQTHRFFGSKEYYAGTRGFEIGRMLERDLKEAGKVEVLLNSTAIGIYPGRVVGVVQKSGFCQERLVKVKAKRIVVATGAYERTLIFENNDLPGIMGAGGVQTLMNVHGIRPGSNGLIIGAGNVGLILAYQLLQAGVKVSAIVEAMPRIGGYFVHAAKVRRMKVPIYTSHTILRALGREKVEGAVVAQLDEKWKPIAGSEKRVECDFICVAVGLSPSFEFLYQAGCDLRYVPELGGIVPYQNEFMETSQEGLYVAGDTSGVEEATAAILGGRIAGLSAVLSLSRGGEEVEQLRSKFVKDLEDFRRNPIGERIMEGKKKVKLKR
ncbi:MAG: FAD-dependent oxidoreductase [Candidatus Bathyarchaeia archaeon]